MQLILASNLQSSFFTTQWRLQAYWDYRQRPSTIHPSFLPLTLLLSLLRHGLLGLKLALNYETKDDAESRFSYLHLPNARITGMCPPSLVPLSFICLFLCAFPRLPPFSNFCELLDFCLFKFFSKFSQFILHLLLVYLLFL